MADQSADPPSTKPPTINLAIGPSCFVKCHGCYNHFGRTARLGGLVTRQETKRFARLARQVGYQQATVSGGDPLTHPEIEGILTDLRELGFLVKLDTVGSAFLRSTPESFYGDVSRRHEVSLDAVAALVNVLGVPLDGSNDTVQGRFRRSSVDVELGPRLETLFSDRVAVAIDRKLSVVDDTLSILDTLAGREVETCVNTTVHSGNVADVSRIARLLIDHAPNRWQLFEFQATGELASRNRETYSLQRRGETVSLESGLPLGQLFATPELGFARDLEAARRAVDGRFEVVGKSIGQRVAAYLLVNDAGDLWVSGTEDKPRARVVGNLREPESFLLQHLSSFLAPSEIA